MNYLIRPRSDRTKLSQREKRGVRGRHLHLGLGANPSDPTKPDFALFCENKPILDVPHNRGLLLNKHVEYKFDRE